jgi:hypothetical protein
MRPILNHGSDIGKTGKKNFKGKRTRAKRLLRRKKGNMTLKSVETQNVEFKSNWRDDAGGKFCQNK